MTTDVIAWLEGISGGAIDLSIDNRFLADTTLAILAEDGTVPPPGPVPAPPPPANQISPTTLLRNMIDPALAWMGRNVAVPMTDEARVELLAIIGQETGWQHRLQVGGPARSWYQFEKGGGVHGVLTHASSKDKIKTICDALIISCDDNTVYEAMAWNGFLATSMARLLLWTDAAALPALGQQQAAWDYYNRNWRPGAPHPEVWPSNYQTALDLVKKYPA